MAAKIDEIDARIAGLRRIRGELAQVVGCACESLDTSPVYRTGAIVRHTPVSSCAWLAER